MLGYIDIFLRFPALHALLVPLRSTQQEFKKKEKEMEE